MSSTVQGGKYNSRVKKFVFHSLHKKRENCKIKLPCFYYYYYYRACFMVYTTHKFRSAIGKSKIVRDGETVLVAFSGGQSSSCLLQLIKDVSISFEILVFQSDFLVNLNICLTLDLSRNLFF